MKLKVKVWDDINKKMIKGKNVKSVVWFDEFGELRTLEFRTILPFINSYDKDGNEVYLGDILEDETGNPAFKLNRDVVKFWASEEVGNCGCCFRVDFQGSAFGIEHGMIADRKIIGNIYEHPELAPREGEEI